MAATLIIRLSSLGDVAMLIPVLYSVARQYTGEQFFLLTKSPLKPLLECRPDNVHIIRFFNHGKHKGVFGLFRLIFSLSKLKITNIADTHNVIRSQVIRLFFRLKGKKTAVLNKGRREKKALTRQHNKIFQPLKTSIQRYQDVFSKLGYRFDLTFHSIYEFGTRNFEILAPFTGKKEGTWIGIAPFAKHQGKIYPLKKMEEVIYNLTKRPGIRLFLFGGKEEETQLEYWSLRYSGVTSVAGHFSFENELLLMSYLDGFISMDSGNMHLASLAGIPVVSIWGATHPHAGFYGYGQHPGHIVQIGLDCRPCSVYGNKPCFRKDYACMNIPPESVYQALFKVLNQDTRYDRNIS